VPARDYGMSVEEILNADDGELNTKLSIKKLAPYREDNDDKRSWREIKKAGSIKRKLANGDEVWEEYVFTYHLVKSISPTLYRNAIVSHNVMFSCRSPVISSFHSHPH